MKDLIEQHLKTIEETYQVKILYACESGSRAWDFASPDSDYDVRFLYVHPRDWYLSIVKQRDVIEYMDDGVLDINGWDIRKALSLLRKSNAPLREWLYSPIVYCSEEALMQPVLELAQNSLMPESLCHHYLSMARKTFATIQQQQQTKIKSYLYTLRPLLCCRWIITRHTQPPMRIHELLAEFLPDRSDKIRKIVDDLIEKKASGNEVAIVERIPVFETYLSDMFAELEPQIPKNPKKLPIEQFDRVFRQIIKENSIFLTGPKK